MAHSPVFDRGTRFTNYSSIHSADAFVGEYQVMFTPGASPQPARVGAVKNQKAKTTRFSQQQNSVRVPTVSQSYILPANLPNTSQIVPNTHGELPEVRFRYTVPADEKQIVASLRMLQQDLSQAMQKIDILTRERDDARHELQLFQAAQNKQRKLSSPQKKDRIVQQVDEELFDLSRMEDSPKKTPVRQASYKRVSIAQKQSPAPPAAFQNQFYPSAIPSANANGLLREKSQLTRQEYRKPRIDEVEQSLMAEDPTAASNTSRRRRHHVLDDNMTSAYILPDITVAQQQQAQKQKVSAEAQHLLQSHDPQHVHNCEVCRRLTAQHKTAHYPEASREHDIMQKPNVAQVTEMIHMTSLEDATVRPKISPAEALAKVRRQTKEQFDHAKLRFTQSWERYDAIQAPLSSRKHAREAEEMRYWQMRMEEYRNNLDNLRDVQEGIESDVDG